MDKGPVTPSKWLGWGALLSCALCPATWGLSEISGTFRPAETLETSGTSGAAPSPRRFVEQGLAIELEIEPVAKRLPGEQPPKGLSEGQEVLFRFSLTDTVSGTPLSGVYPVAWMDRKPDIEDPDHRIPTDGLAIGETCREKVAAFLGGSLLAPPTLDLNVYFVLALWRPVGTGSMRRSSPRRSRACTTSSSRSLRSESRPPGGKGGFYGCDRKGQPP